MTGHRRPNDFAAETLGIVYICRGVLDQLVHQVALLRVVELLDDLDGEVVALGVAVGDFAVV